MAASIDVDDDCTFMAGNYRFGFIDQTYSAFDTTWSDTEVHLGPLGVHRAPVSAKVGWGIVLALALLFAALIGWLVYFRRRKIFLAAH